MQFAIQFMAVIVLSVEKYLKPEVINQIKRLDLRAQFVVKGFLQGLHASPFQGFSVEFSEHRKYSQGDDPKDIDWLVYAKTDKYYIKKFEAETNITGYLMIDLSKSMGWTYKQDLNKFDYAVCLAASLAYLMINQQDPIGLVTFDEKIRSSVAPKSKRTQLGNILSLLSQLEPTGEADISNSVSQLSSMLKQKSLVMIFSDLMPIPGKEHNFPDIMKSLHQMRHGGHDVILFHVLDEAEVTFPFSGQCMLEEPESGKTEDVDANSIRKDYVASIEKFRADYRKSCSQAGIDYVELDTSMQFDKALLEYLLSRRGR